MESMALFLIFFVAIIATFFLSAGINILLIKFFGVSIYPRDFFKSEKDTWSKW